jgi:hypothetical protein
MEPQAIRPTGTGVTDQANQGAYPAYPQNISTANTPPAAGSHEAASMAVDAAHISNDASQQASQGSGTPSGLPFPAPVPQHLQTNPGPQVGAAPSVLNASGLPAMADDTDLIEKEWVVKAKQIVEHTKSDPFIQSRELNKLKAEYIKKRYNKEIRLPEN